MSLIRSSLLLSLLLAAATAHADPTKDQCVASYDAAQKLKLAGKLVAAQKELRTCASAACPAIVTQDCSAWLRDVETITPTVIFAARDDAGQDVTDVTVTVDGAVVQTTLDGKALSIDPGPHVVRLSRGEKSVEQKVLIAEGEKGRVVRVTLPASTNVATSTAPATPGDVAPSKRTIPATSWVLGGVGVAAIGVGTVLAISGNRQLHDLRTTCAPDCAQSDVDATRTKLRIGDAAFAVGILSIGAAIAVYALTPSEKVTPPPVGVAVLPGGAAVDLHFRF